LDDDTAPAATEPAVVAAPAPVEEAAVKVAASAPATVAAEAPKTTDDVAPAKASKASDEKQDKLCFGFNSESGCERGEECKFQHEKGEIDPKVQERIAKFAERKAEKEEERRKLDERAKRFGLPTPTELREAEKEKEIAEKAAKAERSRHRKMLQ